MRLALILAVAILTPAASARAAAQHIHSGPRQVQLVELYTSQGCSSCPPAEHWLSGLKTRAGLWQSLIPVAFHVDYWDGLGWPDPYAHPAYTQRQRAYARQWPHGAVYTPGLVVDGQLWRGWFHRQPLPARPAATVGTLDVAIEGRRVRARFTPANQTQPHLELYLALLAFDQVQTIGRGENAGLTLSQDFVVTGFAHHALKRDGRDFTLHTQLPHAMDATGNRKALAVWVSAPPSLAPIQAAGGWLDR